jgi:hypothetical protein
MLSECIFSIFVWDAETAVESDNLLQDSCIVNTKASFTLLIFVNCLYGKVDIISPQFVTSIARSPFLAFHFPVPAQ